MSLGWHGEILLFDINCSSNNSMFRVRFLEMEQQKAVCRRSSDREGRVQKNYWLFGKHPNKRMSFSMIYQMQYWDIFILTACYFITQVEVLFGEWLWARHSVSYTKLPAYFVAFDIYNKRQGSVGRLKITMNIYPTLLKSEWPEVEMICVSSLDFASMVEFLDIFSM